ncbi:MAG: DUF512 domain-containing protein [Clostridia bacterium]|nr:DUF512 domain-containing protein [Clostridia bacterium]
MAAEIISVAKRSPAFNAGLRAGDVLKRINGHAIRDVLDYKFYSYDAALEIELAERTVTVHKAAGADLGLEFASYLMDSEKSCSNRCIFCFIDQLPKGMRPTLYFKDDDARLSFLLGNYISMTNLSDGDVERIIEMRLSPVNISVHTTEPELRTMMLGNRRGGETLEYLYRMARAGIRIKAQIVLCPEVNDGEHLDRSLRDLSALMPSMESVAVVPVGLTRYREGLYPLRGMTGAEAAAAIAQIDAVRAENMEKYGEPVCFAADELYVKAGLPVPPPEYYCGYSQLENGVGLMALFEEELRAALMLQERCSPPPFTLVCGKASAPFMQSMIDLAAEKCDNLEYRIFAVENDFFGGSVDISGLVTGSDIMRQLPGNIVGDRVILPDVMLRERKNVFLDDVTLDELAAALGCRVTAVPVDGMEFLDAITDQRR